MDDANDVLFIVLTSHGSPDGLVVAGRRQETLTPSRLADILNATHVRYRAVVISACYSGVFIPRLANPNSLVVTAADANHSSFGCEDRAKWTRNGRQLAGARAASGHAEAQRVRLLQGATRPARSQTAAGRMRRRRKHEEQQMTMEREREHLAQVDQA